MNDQENSFRELETLDYNRQQRQSALTGNDMNPIQNLYLNDSLRSWESASIEGSSIDSGDLDGSMEGEALLGPQTNYPNPNIPALFRALYDYLRHIVAGGLFLYSFVLLFGEKGQCYNGGGSIKKLPPIRTSGLTLECGMYEFSHTDIRVIYSAVVILLLDPLEISVLCNLLHRKHMIQLQVTLVVWIIFVINNAEDGRLEPYQSYFIRLPTSLKETLKTFS